MRKSLEFFRTHAPEFLDLIYDTQGEQPSWSAWDWPRFSPESPGYLARSPSHTKPHFVLVIKCLSEVNLEVSLPGHSVVPFLCSSYNTAGFSTQLITDPRRKSPVLAAPRPGTAPPGRSPVRMLSPDKGSLHLGRHPRASLPRGPAVHGAPRTQEGLIRPEGRPSGNRTRLRKSKRLRLPAWSRGSYLLL